MNKADKLFIVLVLFVSFVLYLPSLFVWYQSRGLKKEVVVSYKDEEVLRASLDKDETYEVAGTLGKVEIEVQDGRVRVEKETSPYHLCSIQGWVEDVNRPIVCLPNDIVVQIFSDEEGDVDVVIQ